MRATRSIIENDGPNERTPETPRTKKHQGETKRTKSPDECLRGSIFSCPIAAPAVRRKGKDMKKKTKNLQKPLPEGHNTKIAAKIDTETELVSSPSATSLPDWESQKTFAPERTNVLSRSIVVPRPIDEDGTGDVYEDLLFYAKSKPDETLEKLPESILELPNTECTDILLGVLAEKAGHFRGSCAVLGIRPIEKGLPVKGKEHVFVSSGASGEYDVGSLQDRIHRRHIVTDFTNEYVSLGADTQMSIRFAMPEPPYGLQGNGTFLVEVILDFRIQKISADGTRSIALKEIRYVGQNGMDFLPKSVLPEEASCELVTAEHRLCSGLEKGSDNDAEAVESFILFVSALSLAWNVLAPTGCDLHKWNWRILIDGVRRFGPFSAVRQEGDRIAVVWTDGDRRFSCIDKGKKVSVAYPRNGVPAFVEREIGCIDDISNVLRDMEEKLEEFHGPSFAGVDVFRRSSSKESFEFVDGPDKLNVEIVYDSKEFGREKFFRTPRNSVYSIFFDLSRNDSGTRRKLRELWPHWMLRGKRDPLSMAGLFAPFYLFGIEHGFSAMENAHKFLPFVRDSVVIANRFEHELVRIVERLGDGIHIVDGDDDSARKRIFEYLTGRLYESPEFKKARIRLPRRAMARREPFEFVFAVEFMRFAYMFALNARAFFGIPVSVSCIGKAPAGETFEPYRLMEKEEILLQYCLDGVSWSIGLGLYGRDDAVLSLYPGAPDHDREAGAKASLLSFRLPGNLANRMGGRFGVLGTDRHNDKTWFVGMPPSPGEHPWLYLPLFAWAVQKVRCEHLTDSTGELCNPRDWSWVGFGKKEVPPTVYPNIFDMLKNESFDTKRSEEQIRYLKDLEAFIAAGS